jgi:hypothetical protein
LGDYLLINLGAFLLMFATAGIKVFKEKDLPL